MPRNHKSATSSLSHEPCHAQLPASYQQAPHHYVPVWSAQQPADFQQYPLVPTYEIDLIHSKYAIVRERLSVFYEFRGAEGGGWV
ncbi:hypothetical protein BLNAU_13569 [Blattamonas nauphoetae]|uniref:Uncharacterized protein n=1 Tax=Blattamonas nauphoetae TaxID=2049346 RepID=A0ABQ9XGF5_9EUKA|nr:hypothetical protein BLNAU_13569 [Blattamonas nauphoetae]